MAGIFGQTQVSEMPNPVQPIAPVNREASATALRGIGQMVGTGLDIFAGVQKSKAEAASNALLNEYESKQMELADAVSSGAMDRTEAELMWRTNYNEFRVANPESTPQLREMNKFLAETTGFGKQVFEKSEEEKNLAKQRSDASDAGWVRADMTESQKALATEQYLDFKVVGEKMQRDMQLLDMESKEIGLDSSKLSLLQNRRQEASINNVSSLADKYAPKFTNDMQSIVSRFQTGEIDQKQAYLEIQNQFAQIDSTTRMIGKDAGGDYVANLIRPMSDLKALTEGLISGKIDMDTFNSQRELAVARQQLMISKDPGLVKVIALDSLLKNSDVLTYSGMTAGVVRYLGNGGNTETKPFDPTPDTPEDKKDFKTTLTIVKQNMSALISGTAQEAEGAQQQVDAFVYNTLKGVDAFRNAVENPSDYNEVVDFLSSNEFGKYALKNGIPVDLADNAKRVFQEQYESTVANAVKAEYENQALNLYNQFSPQAIRGENKKVAATELIEPYWNGSGVAFKLKDGVKRTVYSDTTLRRLNDKPAKLINRLVRLDGNLSGNANYRSVYEQRFAQLFGYEKGSEDMNK